MLCRHVKFYASSHRVMPFLLTHRTCFISISFEASTEIVHSTSVELYHHPQKWINWFCQLTWNFTFVFFLYTICSFNIFPSKRIFCWLKSSTHIWVIQMMIILKETKQKTLNCEDVLHWNVNCNVSKNLMRINSSSPSESSRERATVPSAMIMIMTTNVMLFLLCVCCCRLWNVI